MCELGMVRLNIVLSDETEHRLRLAIVGAYGGRKGDLSTAIEQAITEWLAKQDEMARKRGK